jgi:hypothetical protein
MTVNDELERIWKETALYYTVPPFIWMKGEGTGKSFFKRVSPGKC